MQSIAHINFYFLHLLSNTTISRQRMKNRPFEKSGCDVKSPINVSFFAISCKYIAISKK